MLCEVAGKRRGTIMLAHLTIRPSVHQALPDTSSAVQGRGPAQAGPRPLSEPQLAKALSQPEGSLGAETQLQAPPAPASAEAAAEAARQAYIRASIAAGINPLPLPGR